MGDIATFTNPINGRIYNALRSRDPEHYSLGFEIVQRAEAIADYLRTNNCVFSGPGGDDLCPDRRWELQIAVENIELIRGYYDVFGYSWF